MSRELLADLMHSSWFKPLLFVLFIALDVAIVVGVLHFYKKAKLGDYEANFTNATTNAPSAKIYYTCPDCHKVSAQVGHAEMRAQFQRGVERVRGLGLNATLEIGQFCNHCRAPGEPDPWFYLVVQRHGKTIRSALQDNDFEILAAHLNGKAFLNFGGVMLSMRNFEPRVRELIGPDE